jgi:general secretion pathway protein G
MICRHPLHKARSESGNAAGFTLIELLVVLAILALLATVAAPPVMGYLSKAKTDTAKVQLHNLTSLLDLYRLDIGRYPTQEEGLKALVTQPPGLESWGGPYVKKEASLLDPWGNPYIYRFPGEHGSFDLMTLGADKAAGGTGENQDITSW